jgi:hypothetical protein
MCQHCQDVPVKKPARLHNILAPLDGSKGSEFSLPYIQEMAGRLNAEEPFFTVIYPRSIAE